ncbi:WavQ [Photobacterium leiognathi]|uniref:WavQ n=1 Tax=Photobacterium leiognathi TaxID=553611 RepID=UPI0029825D2B|nr:WavQ [Photobacterium leiognathi]
MKQRYIIFAPSYDDNSGGSIVLHWLCHLINKTELDCEAYIFPQFLTFDMTLNPLDLMKNYLIMLKGYTLGRMRFKKNEKFNTPFLPNKKIKDSDIVIYPESVSGNPLKAKNVVRWLLHKPAYHTGKINYNSNELYYKYSKGLVGDFNLFGSKISDLILNTPYYNIDLYFSNNFDTRCSTAYSVRKGIDKKLDKHPLDAICIDGLSHYEISAIFKKCKRFISYDLYSGYSLLAILAGCEVIIVPDDNLKKTDWIPEEELRYGLAYGFSMNEIEWANKTRHLRYEQMKEQSKKTENIVSEFILESISFFEIKND